MAEVQSVTRTDWTSATRTCLKRVLEYRNARNRIEGPDMPNIHHQPLAGKDGDTPVCPAMSLPMVTSWFSGTRGMPALGFRATCRPQVVTSGRSGSCGVPARQLLTTGRNLLATFRRSGSRLLPARQLLTTTRGPLVTFGRSGTRLLSARRLLTTYGSPLVTTRRSGTGGVPASEGRAQQGAPRASRGPLKLLASSHPSSRQLAPPNCQLASLWPLHCGLRAANPRRRPLARTAAGVGAAKGPTCYAGPLPLRSRTG